VASVGIGRRYNATNTITGEAFTGLTYKQLVRVIKAAVLAARSTGIAVDEFGRIVGAA